MPFYAITIHLLLAAAFAYSGMRVKAKSLPGVLLIVAVVAIVTFGFVVERSAHWAWAIAGITGPNTVFFTDLSLAGAAFFGAILWQNAPDRAGKARGAFLATILIGASSLSYAWYFRSLPAGLTGRPDLNGLCLQTTRDSCSAAAAVSFLARHGIATDEAEMADLCQTRAGFGTTPLGLFRGIALKGRSRSLAPQVVRCQTVCDLANRGRPSIITIGLKRDTPIDIAMKMESFGWAPGVHHDVAVVDADPDGQWIDVADPSNGWERWPASDLMPIWDGFALILERR